MGNHKIKFLFLGMAVFMVFLVIYTSLKSDMFHLPEPVLREPWFWTTLVDFYFNITIISAWVIYKEANALKSIVWIVAFVLLGSIATAFYVFLQFVCLKKDEGIKELLIRKNVLEKGIA